MSQISQSPTAKFNKPISKGNYAWKKVNRLAHRLHSKGVPEPIVDVVDNISNLTPQMIRLINFEQLVSIGQMSKLAKMQSVQVLQASLKYEMLRIKRKQTETTESSGGQRMYCEAKQNLGETETNETGRPQDTLVVFI